jgi:hypothetical protein
MSMLPPEAPHPRKLKVAQAKPRPVKVSNRGRYPLSWGSGFEPGIPWQKTRVLRRRLGAGSGK